MTFQFEYGSTRALSVVVMFSLFVFGALGIASCSFADSELQTGRPLGVGTDSGVGVFAPASISCKPLGAVNVFGGERPDLFVVSDRWHPALSLYRWLGDDLKGIPIFSKPIAIKIPIEGATSKPGYVLTDKEGRVFGFWLVKDELIVAKFDAANNQFEVLSQTILEGLPGSPVCVAIRLGEQGTLEGFVSVSDGATYRPGNHRETDYVPYDGAGLWRGGLPRAGISHFTCRWPIMPARMTTDVLVMPEDGAVLGISSLEWIGPPDPLKDQLLYGTSLGGMYFVANAFGDTTDSISPAKVHVTDPQGFVLRHPAVGTYMVAYPSADGERSDLIAAGEDGMYYYRFANRLGERGEPVFELPRRVSQESADLFSGTLAVPNVADWNGDGRLDIVAGNAAGRLLFFENQGTNDQPRFLPATHINAGGEPVLIRGAYRSIQGPREAHWGYTSPTVVDWNQDGLLDIVMNDIRGMHTVYMNRGTPTDAVLSLPRELNVESLEFHGTWRTRPAAGLLGERMAYVTLDDDDQVHLYWRIDDYNLEDAGKLYLTDGLPIQANFLPVGGTGRAKFQLIDWDQDGKIDLLVGTPRHGAFPEPKRGVPWSMRPAGAAVLLLRNVGSNDRPSYEYPSVMHVGGKSMHFGQHTCAPVATTLGSKDGQVLNLLVGTELGRMIYFRGQDVEWKAVR